MNLDPLDDVVLMCIANFYTLEQMSAKTGYSKAGVRKRIDLKLVPLGYVVKIPNVAHGCRLTKAAVEYMKANNLDPGVWNDGSNKGL